MMFEQNFLKTGGDWTGKLWSKFKSVRSKYEQEINEINYILFTDPEELAKYYVEPNCQETNPADHHEERFLTATEPVMKIVDQFFGAKMSQPGDNQLFVLSDAGMGKSALLTMLKLMHLTAFWSSGKDCVLKKLGKKTLDEISEIKEKKETILLLDALDEDTTAYGRIRDRLSDILQATQAFFRVIITCQTQFFLPDTEHDPFRKPGVAVVAGFRCPVKYLSFFNDALVMKYLSKRFPKKFGLFTDTKKIGEAKNVIEKMGSLRLRPMLLSYIEEIMTSPLLAKKDSEYQVYDALIESWMIREKTKNKEVSVENLLNACIILATVLQMKGLREISEENLDKLIVEISKVKMMREIELKGRSLLNRNSEGDYRFSHYSIQEFLVAKLLLSDNPVFTPKDSIHLTDFIFRMLVQSNKQPKFMNLLDFRGLNLSNAHMKGVKLSGGNLSGLELSNANLSDADISDVDLTNANLTGANLIGANLTRANLTGANLRNADFSNSDLSYANFNNSEISGANFTGANFTGTVIDTFEVSQKFFAGLGFKIIPKNSSILELFLNSDLSGIAYLWQEEDIYRTKNIFSNINPLRFAEFKLYIIYKNQVPEAGFLQKLRNILRYTIIPISHERMEEAISTQKYVEALTLQRHL